MTIVSICVCVLLWIAATVRLRTSAGSPAAAAFGRSVIGLAIGAFVFIPPVSLALTEVAFRGSATLILYAACAWATIEMLLFLRYTTDPDHAAAASWSWRGRLTFLTAFLTLLTTTVLLGNPTAADLALPWGSPALQLVFWGAWLTFVFVCMGRMLTICVHYVQVAGPSRLRTSIGLLGGAAACGLLYSVARLWLAVAAVTNYQGPMYGTTAIPGICAQLLLLLLAASSIWAILGSIPALRRRSEWNTLNQLRHLWTDLHRVDPGVALQPLPVTRPTDAADTRLALYRAAIEIRDWIDIIAAHTDPALWEKARDDAHATFSEPLAAQIHATARWLDTALPAYLSNTQHSQAVLHSGGPATSADVDTDIRLLVAVDKARTRHTPAPSLRMVSA